MSVLESLVAMVEPWSTLYSDSTVLAVGLTFAHLGAIMVGGGLALGADRRVLRTAVSADATVRLAVTDAVSDVHAPVRVALAVAAVSGVLMLAADLEALATNRILWIKFGLLAVLISNGLLMLRNERAIRRDEQSEAPFARLRTRAMVSAVCWFAIVLAGVGLMQG
jgi:uncharacterized membrane protein